MSIRLRASCAAALACCLLATAASAQDLSGPTPAPAPAHLAFAEGDTLVTVNGLSERADPPQMLAPGDGVTTRNGRAEIVFGDGSVLHLSHDTALDWLDDERLRLREGRAILRLSHAAGRPYAIDTPGASVRLDAQGEYVLTADRGGRLEVAVVRGAATVDAGQPWAIRGGQALTLRGRGGRPLIQPFNSAQWDAFAAWSHDRATGFTASASAAQLPYELRPYANVLDRHGRWDHVAPHGYVWFPSVGAGWRPYHEGAWAHTRYGWTWHGHDRWAWPTHHYGRWGYTGAFWYWIPAPGWAPAWVTWSVAPHYVGWAPYGWAAGPRDVWGRRDHPAYAPAYNPWRGWTVLPRQHFGPRRNVRPHAVDGDRLDEVTRRVLLAGADARRGADIAVPRDAVRDDAGRSPGERGNVRRPPPVPATPRGDSGGSRSAPAPAGDHPAYAPPPSWSGTADRVRGNPRGEPARERPRDDGGTDRAVPSGAAPSGAPAAGRDRERAAPSDAPARQGRDRDPRRAAPPSDAPKSESPAARPPQSSPSGSAAGAVQRSGASRRKG